MREIRDLIKELSDFLTEFGVSKKVFGNVVKARIDISTLMYKIRKSEKAFGHIKSKKLMPLLLDVYNNLENVRVDVYNPQKGKVALDKNLSNLNASLEALTSAVSEIEFK